MLVFFNQRSCLRYFNANFSPANLTAYVANVNPALTSHVLDDTHVLDDIKICFLKVRRADSNLHAYVADASEIFCTVITKFKYTAVQAWKIDCFILFTIGPEHEINLPGAPYELVPRYFVNGLLVLTTYVIREGPGEHVRLRNLARVSLLTIIKFEVYKD